MADRKMLNQAFVNALSAPQPRATDQNAPIVEQLLSGRGYETIDQMARPLFAPTTERSLFGFAGPEGIQQVSSMLQAERQNEQQMRRAGADWIATQLAIPGSALERKAAHLKLQDALALKQMAQRLSGAGRGGGGGRSGGSGKGGQETAESLGYIPYARYKEAVKAQLDQLGYSQFADRYGIDLAKYGDPMGLGENAPKLPVDEIAWQMWAKDMLPTFHRVSSMPGASGSDIQNRQEILLSQMRADLGGHGKGMNFLEQLSPETAELIRTIGSGQVRGGGVDDPMRYLGQLRNAVYSTPALVNPAAALDMATKRFQALINQGVHPELAINQALVDIQQGAPRDDPDRDPELNSVRKPVYLPPSMR